LGFLSIWLCSKVKIPAIAIPIAPPMTNIQGTALSSNEIDLSDCFFSDGTDHIITQIVFGGLSI
jgi:hypothetical protein